MFAEQLQYVYRILTDTGPWIGSIATSARRGCCVMCYLVLFAGPSTHGADPQFSYGQVGFYGIITSFLWREQKEGISSHWFAVCYTVCPLHSLDKVFLLVFSFCHFFWSVKTCNFWSGLCTELLFPPHLLCLFSWPAVPVWLAVIVASWLLPLPAPGYWHLMLDSYI